MDGWVLFLLVIAVLILALRRRKKPNVPDYTTLAGTKISGSSRDQLNTTGSRLGFSSCPNCLDSWYWKEAGHITYESQPGFSFAVMICTECLANPQRIDPKWIRENLIASGWPEEKVALAVEAIKREIGLTARSEH